MNLPKFNYSREYLLRFAPDADTRGPGGAVTIALCGAWDHEGPCRWPHYSSVRKAQDGHHHLRVDYNCPLEDKREVESRMDDAVRSGRVIGPDEIPVFWELVENQ